MPAIPITPSEAGMRLDRLLRKRLSLTSLSGIYRLIRQGRARVNGRKVKQDCRLQAGDLLEVDIAPEELAAARPGAPDGLRHLAGTGRFRDSFRVIHEDDCVIVCNKPCGLVVHPGTGHGDHDNLIDMARSYLLAKGEPGEPDLAHRLDRDTSGAIIVAKDKSAVRVLHDDLRAGRFTKRYLAVCHGAPRPLAGAIEADLRYTFGGNDGTKVRVAGEGLASRTRYEVILSHGGLAKAVVDLDTGRTHQIRVHFAHIGCPLVGDVRYGDPERDRAVFSRPGVVRRLYLHAWKVTFPHPRTRRTVTVTAPEPAEFARIVDGR